MMLVMISIIDDSGVRQTMDFDYRASKRQDLYQEVRRLIKETFEEQIISLRQLFSAKDITIEVHMEQEQKNAHGQTLAAFNPELSSATRFVFYMYYPSIRSVADFLLTKQGDVAFDLFTETVLHELIHAADLLALKEINQLSDQSYKLYGCPTDKFILQADELPYKWNVQWALLSFFQMFRNEGIAKLGERLLLPSGIEKVKDRETVLYRFKDGLNEVMAICSNLSYYNTMQTSDKMHRLRARSLEAYDYGDMVLLELLRIQYPEKGDAIMQILSDDAVYPYASNGMDILKAAIEMDLSEYLRVLINHAFFNHDLPQLRHQLLKCCVLIQGEGDEKEISAFSTLMGSFAYNGDRSKFIELLASSMGSKMDNEELVQQYHQLQLKSCPEDIVEELKDMAARLLKVAIEEQDAVAQWALTYLFDDRDYIHDQLALLGWQDDWMVLNAACRILGE